MTVYSMRCIPGTMSFSPRRKIVSSRRKISGENDGNSWCPRSLSVKLSGKRKCELGILKYLAIFFQRQWSVWYRATDQKFSITWEPHIHDQRILFCCAGTPCKDLNLDLPPRMRHVQLVIAFLGLPNAIDNPLPSLLSRVIFFAHPPLPEVWPTARTFWKLKTCIFTPHIAW